MTHRVRSLQNNDLPDIVRFSIKIRPNAAKTALAPASSRDSPPVALLKAPPVDGKANRALIELLAREFDVRKADVSIVRGSRSRIKVVEVRHPGSCPDVLSDILRSSRSLSRGQATSGL